MRNALPLALFLLAGSAAPLTLAQEVDAVEWLDNYDEAIKVAKATGKPIFLEYRCEP
jgi:uncharacterized protein YyaL (SSP411 family)